MTGIGRQTDYASRIVLHLACLPTGTQVTADEIARSRLLPPAFVRRIIGKLAGAGILATARGAGGGVSLARPPARISMLDVVRAIEGGITLNACVDHPGSCPLAEACPVQKAWTRATRSLERELDAIRFHELAGPLEKAVPRHGCEVKKGSDSGTAKTPRRTRGGRRR